jgi:diguanylate cyclase (GGDEF)-like protein
MDDRTSNEEQARLAALRRYEILDTEPQEAFDRITRLTKTVLKMPMVLVNIIDKDRQWFLSRQGVPEKEVPRRDTSFCIHAIKRTEPLIVCDTLEDPRFAENPRVVGKPNVRFYVGVPLRSRDGFNIGTLCSMDTKTRQLSSEQVDIIQDFGQLVMDELELRLLANADSLTGAMSRRFFHAEAEREIARAQRDGTELSCALIDIDHFKTINDTYGHGVGDLVLQRVVATCKSELRASEYIGRLGGEEFAVMLPGTTRDSALEVAERIRKAIAAMVVEVSAGRIQLTVSIGLATRTVVESSIELLLQSADTAVYKAKASGRNRTVFYARTDEAMPLKIVA